VAEIMAPTGRQEKSAMRKMFIRMTCLLACDILKREKRRRVLYKFKEKFDNIEGWFIYAN